MGYSLADIVIKMGDESENSTLGWDVVVNYKYVLLQLVMLSFWLYPTLHSGSPKSINS